MSESNVQIRNSGSYDWAVPDSIIGASIESLPEFPYLCSSFQLDSFPSLTVDVSGHGLDSSRRQVLSTPVHESDSTLNFTGLGPAGPEEFFPNFPMAAAAGGYVDCVQGYSIKNETSTLLNLDGNFPEAFSCNGGFDLMCNPGILTGDSIHPAVGSFCNGPTGISRPRFCQFHLSVMLFSLEQLTFGK